MADMWVTAVYSQLEGVINSLIFASLLVATTAAVCQMIISCEWRELGARSMYISDQTSVSFMTATAVHTVDSTSIVVGDVSVRCHLCQ